MKKAFQNDNKSAYYDLVIAWISPKAHVLGCCPQSLMLLVNRLTVEPDLIMAFRRWASWEVPRLWQAYF